MNKKINDEFIGIEDIYVLQCICSELKEQLHQKEKSIDKAIEYIKENGCYDENINDFCDDICFYELRELLDILKGVDE